MIHQDELSSAKSSPRGRWRPQLCLVLILLLAAGLRLWNLADHGFGNIYYAAAVRSMASSWHSFLYASFDPTGFLMLDKPPIAFWLQVLSVKLLGFSGLNLHLPQAIEGSLAVVLVYCLTRRVVGAWGAVLAGLVVAVTPASVAIDRSNLADSCLVLVLLLSAWAVLRATETGRWKWLLLSTALVGLAFNVKFLAAYAVLPTFYLLYWLGTPVDPRTRLAHLCASTATLLAVSFSWPLFVDLTPRDARPYVGDTQDNSVISLALGSKGVRNIAGKNRPSGDAPGRAPGPDDARCGLEDGVAPEERPLGPGERPFPAPGTRGSSNASGSKIAEITGHGGRPGPFRLANRDMAGHITWLIPFAGVGLVALALMSRPRLPLSPLHQAVVLWGGWFATYAAVFSLARAPIHPYYLAVVAPPVGALIGIGAVYLWKAFERGGFWLVLPVAAVILTAVWQVRVLENHPDWRRWLLPILLTGSVVSAIGLLVPRIARHHRTTSGRVGIAGGVLGLAVLFVCPTLWSATPALAPGGRMVPIADPALLDHAVKPGVEAENRAAVTRLVEFLQDNRQSELYLLAVPDIHLAAPIIIETGESVMPYGGFSGRDPILTSDQFSEMVKAGVVRFVMLSDGPSLRMMGHGFDDPVGAWVRRHGMEVASGVWKLPSESPDDPAHRIAPWGPTADIIQHTFRGPAVRIYDCRPTT